MASCGSRVTCLSDISLHPPCFAQPPPLGRGARASHSQPSLSSLIFDSDRHIPHKKKGCKGEIEDGICKALATHAAAFGSRARGKGLAMILLCTHPDSLCLQQNKRVMTSEPSENSGGRKSVSNIQLRIHDGLQKHDQQILVRTNMPAPRDDY